MSSEAAPEGKVCKPNISARGRLVRRRFGLIAAFVAAGVVGAALIARWPWYVRALAFFPAAASGVSLLQVRRNTCVARAREGTFEHDDMRRTPADAADAAASRKVAAGIERDGILVGAVTALVAIATTLIR
jgi:hypothetical protein